ncbi:MAG: glycosyltransferase family 1 protein [Herpetosiphon sp.]
MNVAIDARLIAYRHGGIAHYTSQLINTMVEAAPEITFTVCEHRKQSNPVAQGPNVRRRRFWTPPHHPWEQWTLPLELAPLRPSVIHAPDFIPPLYWNGPMVITVHDLAFLRFPEILDGEARRYYGQINRAVQRAEGIIAVSHSTQRDLYELLGVEPKRVTVIHEAAAPLFQPIDLSEEPDRTFGNHQLTRGSFILFVGTIEPRKNLLTLLSALKQCQEQGTLPLVIAGARGWLDQPVFDYVKQHRLEDKVWFIGGVDRLGLRWLYNACRMYVNPELYAGFGLTVLEAMQCGAPVIAADTSSLPEVLGEAGLLVNPHNVEGWSRALLSMMVDDRLCDDLRARGIKQAAQFTWQQAARATLGLYRRIAQ